MVIAVTPTKKIILVKQYRHPTGKEPFYLASADNLVKADLPSPRDSTVP